MKRICPKCGSAFVATERRPNGDSTCQDCGHKAPTVEFDSEEKMEKDRDPRQPGTLETPAFSINNRLILEPYKKDGLKAEVKSGFAMVQQKVSVKGLKVLMDAHVFEGPGRNTNMIVPRGSIAYIREEILHSAKWAQTVLQSEALEGDFIIADLSQVEFIKRP